MYPDLLGAVREARAPLVSAAITIVRAYVQAGSPPVGTTPMGSFGSWARLVRDAMVWAGSADPVETQRDLVRSRDDEADLVQQLHDLVVAAAHGGEVSSASLVQYVAMTPMRQPEYEATLSAITRNAPRDPTAIGKGLARYADRIVAGRRLVSRVIGGGRKAWRVEMVSG
jgi:hypothetical protein